MLELYKNIKARRSELGITQTELAKRTGYADKSMIAKIENGKVDLPQSKIELFAKALNTTPRFLMGWENPTTITRILTPDESALLDDYQKLNDLGKDRAREDVSDLTEIPRYTAYVPQTIAAHYDGEEMTESQKAAVEKLKALAADKKR